LVFHSSAIAQFGRSASAAPDIEIYVLHVSQNPSNYSECDDLLISCLYIGREIIYHYINGLPRNASWDKVIIYSYFIFRWIGETCTICL